MRTRALFVAALAAAAVLGVFVGSSWRGRTTPSRPAVPAAPSSPPRGPSPDAPSGSPPPPAPFLAIEGTALSAADPSGRRLWDLRAAQLSVDNAKQRVVLSRVTGQFYGGGAVRVTFSAPRAVFHVGSRDVEMSGGVLGRTTDGRVLRAAEVRWSAGQRTIQATGSVVLTQRGVAIHADRVVADIALDQARFLGNVLVQVTE